MVVPLCDTIRVTEADACTYTPPWPVNMILLCFVVGRGSCELGAFSSPTFPGSLCHHFSFNAKDSNPTLHNYRLPSRPTPCPQPLSSFFNSRLRVPHTSRCSRIHLPRLTTPSVFCPCITTE